MKWWIWLIIGAAALTLLIVTQGMVFWVVMMVVGASLPFFIFFALVKYLRGKRR